MKNQKSDIRGLLNPRHSLEKFSIDLFPPEDDLKKIVDRFWYVRWNLPDGETYIQSNLPFPCQHLVIDPQHGSGFFGCSSGKFSYELAGRGCVLGAKFLPGMGQSLIKTAMSEIVDSSIPFEALFAGQTEQLETSLREQSIEETIKVLSAQIKANISQPNHQMKLVQKIVACIETDKNLYNATQLAKRFKISSRHLQRLFQEHVGPGPKWVIDRYRMFEALDALNAGKIVDLADLAFKLKFSDQAHFSKTFKKLTGESPAKYHRLQNDNC